MLNAHGLISIFFATLTVTACASHDKRHVDYGISADYTNITTIDEVTLAAEPLISEEQVREIFDANLVSENYYPVRLILENGSNNRILILRESVELTDPNGLVHRPIEAAIVAEDFENSEIAYGVLGFGVFSYASAKDANLERQADYSEKQMPPSMVLMPGRKRGAFLYFKLPNDLSISSCRLRLNVEPLNSDKEIQLEVPLNAH